MASVLSTLKCGPAAAAWLPLVCLLFCLPAPVPANADKSAPESWRARAEKEFHDTRHALALTNSVENLAAFTRAAFDWAEFAASDHQREELANQGIAAARELIAREPNLVAGHYYLGMNLGQLARTRRMAGLRIVGELEQTFQTAREMDAKFDYAGPDRNLGLLYLQAPGWPLSVGNRRKAREHLERAVQLKPDYPENRLCLIEAYLNWGERDAARRELQALLTLWPKARKDLAGAEFADSWADWRSRRTDFERQLARR